MGRRWHQAWRRASGRVSATRRNPTANASVSRTAMSALGATAWLKRTLATTPLSPHRTADAVTAR
jgi:hypothetical protein